MRKDQVIAWRNKSELAQTDPRSKNAGGRRHTLCRDAKMGRCSADRRTRLQSGTLPLLSTANRNILHARLRCRPIGTSVLRRRSSSTAYSQRPVRALPGGFYWRRRVSAHESITQCQNSRPERQNADLSEERWKTRAQQTIYALRVHS